MKIANFGLLSVCRGAASFMTVTVHYTKLYYTTLYYAKLHCYFYFYYNSFYFSY